MKIPGKCDFCGKSFRGHDPLTDGKGRYFHKKCAPKPDIAGMKKAIEIFSKQHGIVGFARGKQK